jgi:rpsU-divergently transcribed protein
MQKQQIIDYLIEQKLSLSFVSLEQACISLGLNVNYHKLTFPNGLEDVINYYESICDNKMMEYLAIIDTPNSIRDRLTLATQKRVEIVHNYRLIIQNCYLSCNKSKFITVDLIWKYAGDASTDWNYYTKRALLFPIYNLGLCMKNPNSFIATSIDKIGGYNFKKIISKIPVIRYIFT